MTNEEAIKGPKMEEVIKGLKMAIKALEQQPCEDAISRHDVLNCVTSNEFRYRMVEDIKALPPVMPQPKTGHWEYGQYDGNPNITNGEVIESLFPNVGTNFSNVIDLNLWWNAKYKAESEDKE